MNITYVKAPISSNMGNGFFSDGGEYIIRNIVKDKHKISTITHNESTNFLSSNSISGTDLFILGWGCVLTEHNLPRLLKPMYKQKNIIALGFGCTYYNETEKRIAQEFAKHCKLVTTRDNYTYNFVKDCTVTINGIDSGFFCSEFYSDKTSKSEKYCISNIDNKQLSKTNNTKQLEDIQKRYPNYKCFSTTNKHGEKNNDPCKLWNLYKHAEYVSTTRAHTAICCLTEQTELYYCGHMDKRALGMFEACDIDLSTKSTDIKEAYKKIKERKSLYIKELTQQFTDLQII